MSVIVILACSFCAGIALGNFFPVPLWSALAALLLGCIAAFASVLSGRMTALTLMTVVFAAGWSRPLDIAHPNGIDPMERPCYRVVEGIVTSPAVRLKDYFSFAIDMESASDCLDSPRAAELEARRGRLFVSVFGEEAVEALEGDRVRLRAKVKPLVPFFNRGQRMTGQDNPALAAIVDNQASIGRMETAMHGPARFFELLRRDLASFWDRALDPEQALLARALTLGEQRALERDQQDRFRRTGTAHLLSVSGLHLALAVMLVFWAIKKALVLSTWLASRVEVGRIAALFSIPVAVSFTFLAGCQIPVVRACVMAVSALAARACERRTGTVEALALAGTAVLAASPAELFNPGFQLSFSAVIAFVAFLRKKNYFGGGERTGGVSEEAFVRRAVVRIGNASFSLLGSTLAATAVTSPLVLYHFDYFSWVSIFSNMIAVPFTSLLILPGLIIVSAASLIVPDFALLAAMPVGSMLKALDWMLEIVSRTPCTIESPGPWAVSALMACSAASLLILVGKKRGALALFAAALALGALAILADPPRFPKNKLTVDFLDVGQGDSILITFPSGAHWLMDAGGTWAGRFDMGGRVVAPVLRALGVKALDKLILTHADSDHVGGMPAMIEAIDVEEIWDNGQGQIEGADQNYHKLLEEAHLAGIPVVGTPSICGLHCVKDVCVKVVHPCFVGRGYDPSLSFNNNSVVLLLKYGLVNLALLGDIEAEVEEDLVRRGSIDRADVIKLAHHGSDTSSSSSLLKTVKPYIAVASIGRFNRYSFPGRGVVERLKSGNISLFRTDRHGGVRLVTDGRTLSVEGLLPSKQSLGF